MLYQRNTYKINSPKTHLIRLIYSQECYWKFLINLHIQKDGRELTKTAQMLRAWLQNKWSTSSKNYELKTERVDPGTRKGKEATHLKRIQTVNVQMMYLETQGWGRRLQMRTRGGINCQEVLGTAPEWSKPRVRKDKSPAETQLEARVSFRLLLRGSVVGILSPNLFHSPGQPSCRPYKLGT